MSVATAPKTVKAIRYHGNKDIRYEDVPVVTTLNEGELRLKPAWCGICGTDVHEYSHGPFVSYSKESPHPLTGHHRPLIFGHEFSGVVTEVHPSVTSHKIGDAVSVEGLLTDDTCEQCKKKRRNACDQTAFLGLSTSPGGLCEDIVIPAFICHTLPPHVGLDAGALVEPLSVAWHGVTQSGIQPGESAIVFGAGPIGLALILCLRARGITKVLASEPSLARHAQATKIGATHCFNPVTDDVVKGAKDLCDGLGPHFAFDASGVQATLTTGLKAIRKYGILYNIAVWVTQPQIDINELLYNGKTLKADLSFTPDDYRGVIQALAENKITKREVENFITSRIEMEDLEEKGIKELMNHKDRHVKILVRVDKTQPMVAESPLPPPSEVKV
ncbi:GroES-like protein [Pleurostoma richardsiae]|uniref:GroES-like protein n=1 Tax=Pleurostoma richardsiae TaxID=41990 RepID=A0AA38VK47_9PEZI|nr:GroES-like protein [Pleurostoma richardsiae]